MPLTRLADPTPDTWLPFPQIMQSCDWYGFEHFGPCYGNFWAKRPCIFRRHMWTGLAKEEGEWGRVTWRCHKCGSQTQAAFNLLPDRGTL